MSKKALLLTVVFVCVVFRAQAFPAQEGASFGHTWNSYSDKEKSSFLVGIATAVQLTCEPLALVKGDGDKLTVDQERYKNCFNDFAGMEPAKVVAGLNDFYRDSKNAFIPLSGAYRLTMMKLRGNNIDEVLTQARKYGDAVKKKLEEERAKPAK